MHTMLLIVACILNRGEFATVVGVDDCNFLPHSASATTWIRQIEVAMSPFPARRTTHM